MTRKLRHGHSDIFLLCIRKRAKSELSSRSKLKRKFQKATLSFQYRKSIMAASEKLHLYIQTVSDALIPETFTPSHLIMPRMTFIHKDGQKNLQILTALHQFATLNKNKQKKKIAVQQFKASSSYLQTKNQMRKAARANRMRSPTIIPIMTPVFRFAAFSLLVRKLIRSWWPFRP